MASEEHKELAQFIKDVHSSLRQSSHKVGVEKAWQDHCNNNDVLVMYAHCMERLATTFWEESASDFNTTAAVSRIKWTADTCYEYFVNKSYIKYDDREIDIANKINVPLNKAEEFSLPLKFIDVGSCYNPFKDFDFLDVLAIDLCPANKHVEQCDFLSVLVNSETVKINNTIKSLQMSTFEVVTFCFLLEYIPSSQLRIKACEKAYDILKPGGLLIINTPDSKHVGANCKLMKCWRYTLALMGFSRIKYEKFKHMHSMAFRKSLNKATAVRWADMYKEPYMEYALHIPQDFQEEKEEHLSLHNNEISPEDFNELPHCE